MPTGYTAPIYDGKEIDFATFALRTARAMGPCVILRDHDADVLPTEENVVESTTYHEKALAKATEEIAELESLSEEELVARTNAYNEERSIETASSAEDRDELRQRYEQMLEQVVRWTPPTADHQPLKEYMVEQLTSSIEHDTKGFEGLSAFTPLTPTEYKERQLERAKRDRDYHAVELPKAQERNEWRSTWVRALRESLREEVPA
jgi:hypothetical protein